jgi:4-alpha-glucanotransferase
MRDEELRRQAEAAGVATGYHDGLGQWHEVSVDTLRTVLEAVGPPPSPSPGPSAAARCRLPPDLEAGGRAWGWAVQLYALRSETSWGIGDLGDLASLLRASDPPGFVLLNPLHARTPGDPSPYAPSSRRFRDPLYIRVEAVPELAALSPDARAEVSALAKAGRDLNRAAVIDRAAVWGLKHDALWRCYQALARAGSGLAGRRDAFAAWRARTEGVEEFAAFSAAGRHDPGYQAWLQWVLEEQLRALPWPPGSIGVINDLAIGFSPDGFDAHSMREVLAEGVTIGAPPDLLAPQGQNWGLSAWAPGRLAAAGYEPFASTLRASLEGAGGLRVDHVMGLFRLFLIPSGAPPAEGTYVRCPAEELLGILAAESARADALVVGEDLGTVEPGVRERLAAARVLSYRLAWFEREPPAEWPRLALAAVTTHDLPTIAGRFAAGDAVEPDADAEGRAKAALLDRLEGEGVLAPGERAVGQIADALHGLLARTPCMLVAASLDDAVLAVERPNLPGTTGAQRPNWSRPLPLQLEDLLADPRVRALAGRLSEAVRRRPNEEPAEQGI